MGKRNRREEDYRLRIALALIEIFTAMLTLLIAIFEIIREFLKK